MGDFHVKRIILPSGKAVEIVYFDATREDLAEPAPRPAPEPVDETPQLECCPACSCEMVHPLDWREAECDAWELELRCPNCGWCERGVYAQEVVERYDAVLNEGTDTLIEALEKASRENMEADIERFVQALERDLIEPFDF